jgi:starvation-inducible outer membrane lipoprotein
MVKALILAAAISLAACTTTPAPVEDPRRVWCEHSEPARHSPAAIEQMARAELDHVNTHNRRGQEWCGWRP